MAKKRRSHIPLMASKSFILELSVQYDIGESEAPKDLWSVDVFGVDAARESGELQPEIKLWTYCVLDAIRQATIGNGESFGWLFVDDSPDIVGTFDWVCDTLEISKLSFQERLLDEWPKIKIQHYQYNRLARDLRR